MKTETLRLHADRVDDFYKVHSKANDHDWCFCTAWWVDSWEGFGDRTAGQNRSLREKLFEQGEFDGYLMYLDGEPVGWCQCGLRDRLPNLVATFALEPEPEVWAITCFLIAPSARGKGLAKKLLEEISTDLAARGVKRVQAFPRPEKALDSMEAWTGPVAMYERAGFKLVRDTGKRSIYEMAL
jgi:GNAT superfamily N-acetyltransferase